jgi:hypothetical protein
MLTILFGIPLTIIYGIILASVEFFFIWMITPMIQTVIMIIKSFKRFVRVVLATCLGPIIETMALYFSKVNITFNKVNITKGNDKIREIDIV